MFRPSCVWLFCLSLSVCGTGCSDPARPASDGSIDVSFDVRQDTNLTDRTVPDSTQDAVTDTGPTIPSSASITPPALSVDFGSALAISGNGTTLVVGDWTGGVDELGAVTVYTRTGSSWNSGVPLSRPANAGAFGTSVAVSDDGSRIVVGDWSGGTDTLGQAFVFSSSNNFAAGQPLTRPANSRDYGWSIATSGDGTTIAVGDYAGGTDGSGAVSVYSINNDVWSAPVVLRGPLGSGSFGDAIALSDTGNVLVVGDTQGGGDELGAAIVFTRTQSSWDAGTQLTRPIDPTSFGFSVAVNGAGNVITVGDPSGTSDMRGAVRVFTNTGTGWDSFGASLVRQVGANAFGGSVDLSASGRFLAVGDFEGDQSGAAHTFTGDTQGPWTTARLTRPAQANGFGRVVVVSADGRWLAVSAGVAGSGQVGTVSVFEIVN